MLIDVVPYIALGAIALVILITVIHLYIEKPQPFGMPISSTLGEVNGSIINSGIANIFNINTSMKVHILKTSESENNVGLEVTVGDDISAVLLTSSETEKLISFLQTAIKNGHAT